MSKFVVVILPDETKAYEGTRAFAALHSEGNLTVYGVAVVTKNKDNKIFVKDAAESGPLGIAVGAPTFAADGAKFISHLLIDEHGETAATISKRGLTEAEATFFARASSRPLGKLHGLRCSAVICREVEDLELGLVRK